MTVDLFSATIQQLRAGLDSGQFTSVDLTKAYLARVEEVNAELHCIIETNPHALSRAQERDEQTEKRGLLHGIPIIVKDNIGTLVDNMETTAGFSGLIGSVVPYEAFVITKLLAAGAIIFGKANLSEWSYFRGDNNLMASGWSMRGGQCINPYMKNGNPSGSSSGSAVSMAVALAAGSLGTETDGSIISPSTHCNVVGIKPTVGLVSRSGVIPISEHQDTVGPICRTVSDAAIILQVIAGPDPRDKYTTSQPDVPDYISALKPDSLKGIRLGVPRKAFMTGDEWNMGGKWGGHAKAFENGLKELTALGAIIVEDVEFPGLKEKKEGGNETIVLDYEFKDGINRYLAELVDVPTGVRTVADIIKYNDDHPDMEKPPKYEDQSRIIKANKCGDLHDPKYLKALERSTMLGREEGIDYALKTWNLDAIVFPSLGNTVISTAAIAGYPIITVPLGFTTPETPMGEANPKPTIETGPNMPFGLGFTGTAYSERKLISYAYAFEQKFNVRATFGGKDRVRKEALPTAGLVLKA